MASYLIFRTDRIGDFIFSRMVIDSIKKNDPYFKIDFVCSEYNSKYAINFKDIKNIYILKKSNFFQLLETLVKVNKNKYDKLIILDGKRRSIFFSIFVRAFEKIVLLKSFRSKIILNFFLINISLIQKLIPNFKTFLLLLII